MSEISWRFSPTIVEDELNAILPPLASQNPNIEYSISRESGHTSAKNAFANTDINNANSGAKSNAVTAISPSEDSDFAASSNENSTIDVVLTPNGIPDFADLIPDDSISTTENSAFSDSANATSEIANSANAIASKENVADALISSNSDSSNYANSGGREMLRAAMRHAVFSGGKRLRSQLVLEAASVVGGANFDAKFALPAACALEMIHAYSLVHDDLPSMDNADTRRGRPSCHKQFGEATAILAGDALLTSAFEVLADTTFLFEDATFGEVSDATSSTRNEEIAKRLRALKLIAHAAGESGMVGGQAIDIAWSNEHITDVGGDELLAMHALKTGALLRVASESGALLGGGTEIQIAALRDYGIHLGRAFQIADDVLDVTGDPNQTGKAASDADNDKITATGVFGLERARQMAHESAQAALDALQIFGTEAAALRQLAHFVVEREK